MLRQFPFATVPTWRVIYESNKLGTKDIHAAAQASTHSLTQSINHTACVPYMYQSLLLPPTSHLYLRYPYVCPAQLLRSHGFISLESPLNPADFSVWHHNRSREVWRRTRPAAP